MQSHVRNGLVFGAVGAVTTFGLNLINDVTTNVCHRSAVWPLLAFMVFVGLAGAAGRQSARSGGNGAVAGLITGAISGIGFIVMSVYNLGTQAQAAAQCLNAPGLNLSTLSAVALVGMVVDYLIGLGVGAGAGAIGASLSPKAGATAA